MLVAAEAPDDATAYGAHLQLLRAIILLHSGRLAPAGLGSLVCGLSPLGLSGVACVAAQARLKVR